MNNCKKSLLSNIDVVSGPDEISQLWRNQNYELLKLWAAKLKGNPLVVDNVEFNSDVVITSAEVHGAIFQLKDNKTCGQDDITAEHIKFASKKLYPLVALCFTGLFVHGVLPDSMLSVVLVPVINDKVGKLNSSDNYRPIALASVICWVDLRGMSWLLTTSLALKRKHGTDLCILALKEILDNYNRQNSTMFMCFIDASEASIKHIPNHGKLFLKLSKSGVSDFLTRILVYWQDQDQTMTVRWGNVASAPFHITDGVHKGGILSPFLSNMYMNDLSLMMIWSSLVHIVLVSNRFWEFAQCMVLILI